MMVIEHSKYTKLSHLANFSFQKSYGGSIFIFEFESEQEIEGDSLENDGEEE